LPKGVCAHPTMQAVIIGSSATLPNFRRFSLTYRNPEKSPRPLRIPVLAFAFEAAFG
jgi:hypothetical protein